jgi:hypothetical protein
LCLVVAGRTIERAHEKRDRSVTMRNTGINYDTGFLNGRTSTRESFDPDVVRREMHIIRDDLHCTAVRVTGGDPNRLETAATHAAGAGLAVWFSPFTNDLTQDGLLALLADCAERAERLRRRGAEVVLLASSELSLTTVGFLPGETLAERLALVADPLRVRPLIGEVRARVNTFLRRAVAVVRARFGGPVSYASLPLEGVDWAPFDIIATDAGYRSAATAAHFRESVHAFVAQGRALGKPVAVTEFGCMTHRGAAAVASDVLTLRSSTRLRGTTCRTAKIHTWTSTWRAAAWSRCSTGAVASATRTCPGSPRPRLRPWRRTIAHHERCHVPPRLPRGRAARSLPLRIIDQAPCPLHFDRRPFGAHSSGSDTRVDT